MSTSSMVGHTYRYRAWDGTQAAELLSPEQVLAALTGPLLDGSIDQALDRALHRGLTDDDLGAATGIDRLRDQLRVRRSELEGEVAGHEGLQTLADQLAGAAGGSDSLDAAASQMLAALAARPDAARVLGNLPPAQRELIAAAMHNAGGGQLPGDDAGESHAGDFGGWLDDVQRRIMAADDLEQQLRRVRRVQDVGDVDDALIRAVLGVTSAEQFERLAASLRQFIDSGFVRAASGPARLSARALQHIGDELLSTAIQRIATRGVGDRRLPTQGRHELTGTTRDYEFGDPLALDLSRTVMQAIRRGPGVPVRLNVDDFAIFEREDSARAATVLALDLSRSMGERGYLLAAKKLALALSTLVRTRFPRDEFELLGFSDTARMLTPHELPHLTWDRFGFGTNVQDALRLARARLAARRGMQRNIILLTDGEPTAHSDLDGKTHFHHPTAPETLTFTYAEADRARRDGVSLWVCVLSEDMQVVKFAEQLAKTAAGELIVTAPDDLSAALVTRYGAVRR